MAEAEVCGAQFTPNLPPPTDEELALMMELKAEQAQLMETRSFYTGLAKYLYNEFQETHNQDFSLRQENSNLRAELFKIALKFGFELPQEEKWKQSMSTQAVESIDDFFLRMLKAAGSERIRPGDLQPDFPTVTPYSDSQAHRGAAVYDLDHCTIDADSSLSPGGVQAAAPNAAVREDRTPRTISQVEASDVNASIEVRGKVAPCALLQKNGPQLMRPEQSQKLNECNPLPQRIPISMPVQQPATKAAVSDPFESNAFPKPFNPTNCTSMQLEAGWKPERCFMHTATRPSGSSGCEHIRVQGRMGACKAPPQHPKPLGSCEDMPVALPSQSPAIQIKTNIESQGESIFAVEEHLQPHAALETAGTRCELSPSAQGDMGGVTTLVIRNIPARYTKVMLLQEWLVDGTFDFIYLPFSFKQKKTAGFVFLNFTSSAAASAFQSQWHGRPLCAEVSSKLSIGAAEVQGLEENVWHLIKCKINRVKNPKYLPSVFDGAREVPFGEYVEQLEQRCKNASAEQKVKLHRAGISCRKPCVSSPRIYQVGEAYPEESSVNVDGPRDCKICSRST